MKRAAFLPALLALALLGGAMTPPAMAQPAVGELIARLKREGDEAFAGGRYRDAIKKYDESLAISPDPSIHYSRARAFERLGKLADAIRAYELFVAEASPELTARVPDLPMHVASLKPKTALLKVSVRPDGATVTMGETTLGTSPIERPLRLDPGRFEVVVTRPGFLRESRTVVLTAGEEAQVSFALAPVAGADRAKHEGVVAPATERAGAPAEPRPITSRWWFWTGIALAGAAAATTVVILTREPSESKGDIEPGRLTAPLLRF